MVFESRKPTGRIACDLDNRDVDEITSRILWLDGLEQGINREGDCDTWSRYIYIHGTPDDTDIRAPGSRGCVRMRNRDSVRLFDLVRPGTPVNIVEA